MENASDKLITHLDPRSPVSEAYRTLRTNIQFSSLDKPIRTLLVTSSGPEEGKSTTIANLAITIAQTGSRVILVDCDLRRPSQHRIFGLHNNFGLTNLVLDEAREDLFAQETSVPNLRLLSAGPLPPNPSELLGSRRMEEIVKLLLHDADMILFDTPPVIAVTDAAVLARKVDGVLLVIKASQTKRDHARKARQQLDRVNANLIGVVLNNVKYDSHLNHYYADQDEVGSISGR